MVKIIKYGIVALLMVFGAGAAYRAPAQHYVGVRAGYGGGTASRIFQKEETGTLWGLYNGGLAWKYFSPEKYVGGVEVDMIFMQQGYKNYTSPIYRENLPQFDLADTTLHEKRLVNTVMVPIFWQPHVYMFRRHMRVFLNLGVTFSYVVNQRQGFASDLEGEFITDAAGQTVPNPNHIPYRHYPMMRTRDNRWGYGLCGGGGLGWSFGRVEAAVEMRYYIGYSDLMKNVNKYRTNPHRSPLDGLQGSVAVFYRLGKKGILSPPSKKMEQKLLDLEEKRRMRDMERGFDRSAGDEEGRNAAPDTDIDAVPAADPVPADDLLPPGDAAFALRAGAGHPAPAGR